MNSRYQLSIMEIIKFLAGFREFGYTDIWGLRQGIWRQYDDEQVLVGERTYKDDVLNGPYRLFTRPRYFRFGDPLLVCEKGTYLNGFKEGEVRWFYAEGNPSEIAFHKQGVKDGPFQSFYRNKQLRAQGFYKNGLLDGDLNRFHSNGIPAKKCHYKAGLLDGDYLSWYRNGQLKEAGSYDMLFPRYPQSPSVRYHANGRLKRVQGEMGLDDYFVTFDENGVMRAFGEIDWNEDKEVIESGALAPSAELVHGLVHDTLCAVKGRMKIQTKRICRAEQNPLLLVSALQNVKE